MKTKTDKAPKIVAGAGYKEIERGDYRCCEIGKESNFRKVFNEKAIKELADNIAKVGVLQPIILRHDPAKKYPVLVAGERRLRAAQLAGIQTIPGRILDITAEQALEVQALENLHRKDLTPLEEARSFKALLDAKGHNLEQVQELADRVDKSTTYIYRAVRLLELPEKITAGIDAGTLTAAHGHQLLRAPKENWDKLATALVKGGWNGEVATAIEFAGDIECACGKNLKHAYFPKDEVYADEVACSTCQFNSGNQNQLFDGAEKGKCLSTACFTKKQDSWMTEKAADAAEYSRKIGLAFLGSGKEGGYGEFKRNKILTPAEAKGAKDPKKYAVGFMTGSPYGGDTKPHMVIVRLADKKKSNDNSAENHDWEKHNFIQNAVTDAVYAAEAVEALRTIKASKEAYAEAALNALRNTRSVHFANALGVEKIVLSKLTDDQLAAVLVGSTRGYGWHPKKKQIEAEAKKKATAEYEAKKAKPAGAKK